MSVDSDPSRRGGSREPIHLNWFIDVWLYLLSLHPFRDDFGAADD